MKNGLLFSFVLLIAMLAVEGCRDSDESPPAPPASIPQDTLPLLPPPCAQDSAPTLGYGHFAVTIGSQTIYFEQPPHIPGGSDKTACRSFYDTTSGGMLNLVVYNDAGWGFGIYATYITPAAHQSVYSFPMLDTLRYDDYNTKPYLYLYLFDPEGNDWFSTNYANYADRYVRDYTPEGTPIYADTSYRQPTFLACYYNLEPEGVSGRFSGWATSYDNPNHPPITISGSFNAHFEMDNPFGKNRPQPPIFPSRPPAVPRP